MANDKTEKATPKKKEDARKKGQVAKSADVNGSAVLLAGLLALTAAGPKMVRQLQEGMLEVLALVSHPEVVDQRGVGTLFVMVGMHVGVAALPVMGACMLAGFVASIGQVGFHPSAHSLKPDFKKINPASGLKNLFGPNTLFEAVKN